MTGTNRPDIFGILKIQFFENLYIFAYCIRPGSKMKYSLNLCCNFLKIRKEEIAMDPFIDSFAGKIFFFFP
jgi:hypothetical protein